MGLEWLLNRDYRGLGWWALGVTLLAASFPLITVRDVPALAPVAIVVPGLIQVASQICAYLGVTRFLGRAANRPAVLAIGTAAGVTLPYFAVVDDNIGWRVVIVSLAVAACSALTARALLAASSPAIQTATRFSAAVYVASTGFFAVRAASTILLDPVSDILAPTLSNELVYVVALVLTSLWVFGLILMVNQRQRADLLDAKQYFERIFELIPEPVAITRLTDGRLVGANAGFASIVGATPRTSSDLPTDAPSQLDPADYQRLMVTLADRAGSTNQEVLLRRTTGDDVIGIVSSRPVSLAGVPHSIGVMRDITERKRLEDALRESEAHFRSLFSQSPIGIEVYDAHGSLIDVNAACLAIFGITDRAAVSGFKLFDDPNLTSEIKARLRAGESGRYEFEFDFDLVRELGLYETSRVGRIHLDAVVTPLRSPNADTHGYLVQVQDITDRKRAEQERDKLQARLLQAQKMEAIGNLAGGIAHDFNNTLSIILGSASLVELELPVGSPQVDRIRLIEQACDRGAALTSQLLGFARRGRFEARPVDPASLISEIVRLIRPVLDRAIAIETRVEDRLWPVIGDANQLHQVLMNLAINARDAMPAGGNLTISASNIALDDSFVRLRPDVRAGSFVLLSVQDTGIGMDTATVTRIFDPFFTTKDPGKGTGLGLASAHGIVQNHGGFIDVTSEPGIGTTMRVYLPASRVRDLDTGPVGASQPASKGTSTLLLIDDEQAVQEVGTALLAKLGYKVMLANNGLEGIEVYRRHQPEIDLVILDMNMPVQGGRETARQLFALNPACRILLASGYSRDGEAAEIMQMGTVTFLQKPFRIGTLADAVSTALHPGPKIGSAGR